jgi:hypothetical protein
LCGGAENGIKEIVVDGALPPTLTCQDLSRKRSSFSLKIQPRKRIKHYGYRFYRFELTVWPVIFGKPEVIQKWAWRRSMEMSPKDFWGVSEISLSDYKRVARHNLRVARYPPGAFGRSNKINFGLDS